MKRLILIFLIIIVSCESNNKTQPNPLNQNNYHLVEFLDKKVYLPDNFKKTTFETFEELIKSKTDLDTLSNYEFERINSLKNLDNSIELFVGNNDFQNNISFQESPYFDFDKDAVALYVDILENNLFLEPKSRGIEFERLESKFLRYGLSKIIKVKYLRKFEFEEIYLTQYLVSYKLKTFGIIVANKHGNDYQFILKNFKK